MLRDVVVGWNGQALEICDCRARPADLRCLRRFRNHLQTHSELCSTASTRSSGRLEKVFATLKPVQRWPAKRNQSSPTSCASFWTNCVPQCRAMRGGRSQTLRARWPRLAAVGDHKRHQHRPQPGPSRDDRHPSRRYADERAAGKAPDSLDAIASPCGAHRMLTKLCPKGALQGPVGAAYRVGSLNERRI